MAYATLAALKRELGISETTDDALLNDKLIQASAAIDTYCGRTFYAAVASVRYFDPTRDVDGRTLFLGEDLAQIVSVTNGDATTVTSVQYVTEPRNSTPYYALTLLASTGLSWEYTNDPENAISINGYWAYSTTPPSDVVTACLRWAGYLYRLKDAPAYDSIATEQGIISIPQGVPRDVIMLLAPYRRRV